MVKWVVGLLIGAVVAVFLVDLVEGPLFSLSTRTWPPELHEGKVIGGIEGAVKAADRDTGTLLVASGFLGLSSLPVVVTPQTEVAVRGKLGGVADLDRGQTVRIAYEVLPDRLLAQRVDVLDGVVASNLAPAVEVDRKASAEEAPAVTEAVSNEPAASAPAAPSAELPPRAAAPAPAPPVIRPTTAAAVAAPKRPPANASPAAKPSTASAPAPRPTPPPAATVLPRSTPSRSTDDGTDAVDWLLKGGTPAR